jgi:hypothetical protein
MVGMGFNQWLGSTREKKIEEAHEWTGILQQVFLQGSRIGVLF